MLKKRIGAALIVKDNWVVQSIGFKKYLPVGRPEIAVEFLNKWGVDEIFLMDISASRNNSVVSADLVKRAAGYCRVPFAVGGGIVSVQQMELLLHSGADKIAINHALLNNPSLITQGARLFGDQCMVAVIDFVTATENSYVVYDYTSNTATDRSVVDYARQLEEAGAGELVLQSVNRDGKYKGFDIGVYQAVCSAVKIPVVALGGAGNASHFNELLNNTEVSAACAGNIFNFSEHSVNTLKAQLVRGENAVRLETQANYQQRQFDSNGRLSKASDQYLEDLLFVRIDKEVI